MYLMTIPDGEGMIVTQRFYKLLKSMYFYGNINVAGDTRLVIGDFVVSFAHTAIIEKVQQMFVTIVNKTFILGEDEFLIDERVHYNNEWNPDDCQEIPREEFVGELMEFLFDYYPEFGE